MQNWGGFWPTWWILFVKLKSGVDSVPGPTQVQCRSDPFILFIYKHGVELHAGTSCFITDMTCFYDDLNICTLKPSVDSGQSFQFVVFVTCTLTDCGSGHFI